MRLAIVFALAALASGGRVSYKDCKVYRVASENDDHAEVLRSLEDNPDVDFWSELVGPAEPANVMVKPRFQDKFAETLNEHGIPFETIVDDAEAVFEDERLRLSSLPKTRRSRISFDRYYRYSEIQDYLHYVASSRPELVSLEHYGLSYENRNLTALKFTTGGNDQKPVIFVDAGIHAREWIAPPQALYLIEHLLLNPGSNPFLRTFDWVVIPLLNPDGYEYTHTTDRMWRKTRSKGKVCHGVDPNRNFDYQWGGPGTSEDECSNTYAGPSAFSEPETSALSEILQKYASRTKLYLTFHSAAQCFLHPWGYSADPPPNFRDLQRLGTEAAAAAARYNGTVFRVGSSFSTLAPASGSSRDWAYGAAGIRLAYTMELPPGPGPNHFDMPPERILPVTEEMFEAVKVFHKRLEQRYRRF